MTAVPQEEAVEVQDLTHFAAQQQWIYERARAAWNEAIGRPLPINRDEAR